MTATTNGHQAHTNGSLPAGVNHEDPNGHRPEPIDVGVTSTRIDETTMAELREIMARYPQPRSALLPMLHLVQSVEGRVTPKGIEVCAELLDISAADVSGVATFYTMYKRRPVGEYHVGVCTTSLCAIMGGDELFAALQDHLEIGNDETTGDGLITLEHIECNAACDLAPVMTVNWEFFDQMTPASAVDVVDRLRAGEEVQATRGARVCGWKAAERVLAGYPDGRADEGPTSAATARLGLDIAAERGWSAPAMPGEEQPIREAERADQGDQPAAPGSESQAAGAQGEAEESALRGAEGKDADAPRAGTSTPRRAADEPSNEVGGRPGRAEENVRERPDKTLSDEEAENAADDAAEDAADEEKDDD